MVLSVAKYELQPVRWEEDARWSCALSAEIGRVRDAERGESCLAEVLGNRTYPEVKN